MPRRDSKNRTFSRKKADLNGKSLQNPVQYSAASTHTELQTEKAIVEKQRELPLLAAFHTRQREKENMTPTGLEPVLPA